LARRCRQKISGGSLGRILLPAGEGVSQNEFRRGLLDDLEALGRFEICDSFQKE
jgi:hypothetical protein